MFKQFKPTPKFWAVSFYLASSLFMAWFALLCAVKMYALYPWVGSLIWQSMTSFFRLMQPSLGF